MAYRGRELLIFPSISHFFVDFHLAGKTKETGAGQSLLFMPLWIMPLQEAGTQPTYFMPEFSVAVMSLTRLADHSEYSLFIMALRTWTIQ